MLFKDLVPMTVYKGQTRCPVPKGSPIGYGESIILLTPSKEDSMRLLENESFIYYREGLFRYYYIDSIMREKIGNKLINVKSTKEDNEEFNTHEFSSSLISVQRGNKIPFIKRKKNVFIDMGRWNEHFFRYQKKLSPLRMAQNYISFLTTHLKESDWRDYHQTIYIDASQWASQLNSRVVFESDQFNNPITMILFLLYKNSISLEELQEFDFVIFNSNTRVFMYLDKSSLINTNFGKIKAKLLTIIKGHLDVEDIQNLSIEDETAMISSGVSTKDEDTIRLAKIQSKIRSGIAKQFVGDDDKEEPVDARPHVFDEDDEKNDENDEDDNTPEVSVSDPDLEAEIDSFVDDIMNSEDDADTLEQIASDPESLKKTAKKASDNIFTNSFTPNYTKVELNRIAKLQEAQDKVIPPITSEKRSKSKIIQKKQIAKAVRVPNDDLKEISFSNFDKSYNEQKLEDSIDSAVTAMGNGTRKVFVTSKEVKDTSNQLTLKETRTYHLQDETGKKMTVKFDVPKIVDDRYLYINGNKQIIGHMFVSKPIIKTKEDEVKINTWYNKLIIRRRGLEDTVASPIQKHLIKNAEEFKVTLGNGHRKNGNYIETIESSIFGKRLYSFDIEDWHIITAIDDMIEYIKGKNVTIKKSTSTEYPIAFNTKTKEVLYFDADKDSYGKKIRDLFDEVDLREIDKRRLSSRQFYAKCEIMSEDIPLALLILHTIGLTEMLKMAKIETEWVPRVDKSKLREYNDREWGITELSDGFLMWKREPMECAMLMNGVNSMKFKTFTREEMDNKDTYIYTLNSFYSYSTMSFNLDQFANFMIDDTTKEILEDFHLPTTYCELLLFANKLLTRMDYLDEMDMRSVRVRSNELIPLTVYKTITDAYGAYRKSWTRRHPISLSIKSDEVMKRIQKSQLTADESVLNPFLELEKGRAISVRGNGGISRAGELSIQKRAFSESMLGVVGITSSTDANIGIARQLTLEPMISSTLGYIDFKGKKNVDELTAANLLTPGELLTPLGIEHDDPVRSAMAVKQSKYMIPIDESEPGMITNGVDRVLPYHMSKEFVNIAEDDGVVIAVKDELIVVKYNNGRYQTIDTSTKVKKNGSAGFWIVTKMICNKKKGDTVKKDEVIACERQAFKKNDDDLSATMTRGPFVKIAIVPRWDCYEDSNPITEDTSNKMASTMAMEEIFSLSPNADVHSIAKVGDFVNSGDILIAYDEFAQDAETQAYMQMLHDKLKGLGDEFIESAATTKKVHHTGEIADIKIYTNVSLDEMSPSMRNVVQEYYDKLNAKIEFIKKYKNPGDNDYYMSGQRISEFPEPIEADSRGRLKGELVGDGGVVFCFYIKHKDYIKKGDKITSEFALKGVASQVIENGLEPYSEFRPDEPIGLVIAPHSPMARKTTGIFKAMFINKLLIERKRQIAEYWKSIRSSIKI